MPSEPSMDHFSDHDCLDHTPAKLDSIQEQDHLVHRRIHNLGVHPILKSTITSVAVPSKVAVPKRESHPPLNNNNNNVGMVQIQNGEQKSKDLVQPKKKVTLPDVPPCNTPLITSFPSSFSSSSSSSYSSSITSSPTTTTNSSSCSKSSAVGNSVKGSEREEDDEEDTMEEEEGGEGMDYSSEGSEDNESEEGSVLQSPTGMKQHGGKPEGSGTRSLRTRRNRRQGSFSVFRRLVDERVRHKRQTLQDMARPLKQWLYHHRDNPYPTKSEKVALAQGSQMTLTQVSNWFANARRRLKNTVKDPNLSWARRIKLYNSCVVGNAELLSISSEDSIWDDSDDEREKGSAPKNNDTTTSRVGGTTNLQYQQGEHDYGQQVLSLNHQGAIGNMEKRTLGSNSGKVHCDYNSSAHHIGEEDECGEDPNGPHKYKHSILQRYLNDAYEHSFSVQEENEKRKRNPSGSLSSHDYEEMSVSSRSSPAHEHSFYEDNADNLEQIAKQWGYAHRPEDEMYWKEISAALALTTLARSRSLTTQ